MPKPKIDAKDLHTAIAWERARANVLENWGHDAREIRALADNYARRLMDLDPAADSQQFCDVPEAWSAESIDLEVTE